jgi:hypothetical protein
MIESDFAGVFGSEAVASFQRQFDFGIEALNDAAGELAFGGKLILHC